MEPISLPPGETQFQQDGAVNQIYNRMSEISCLRMVGIQKEASHIDRLRDFLILIGNDLQH